VLLSLLFTSTARRALASSRWGVCSSQRPRRPVHSVSHRLFGRRRVAAPRHWPRWVGYRFRAASL